MFCIWRGWKDKLHTVSSLRVILSGDHADCWGVVFSQPDELSGRWYGGFSNTWYTSGMWEERQIQRQQESLELRKMLEERAMMGGGIFYACSMWGKNMYLPVVADKQKGFRIKLDICKSSPTVSVLRWFNSATKECKWLPFLVGTLWRALYVPGIVRVLCTFSVVFVTLGGRYFYVHFMDVESGDSLVCLVSY